MEKRECHKCRYNGQHDPRCIKCPGPAPVSYKGISYVYPDGTENPAGIYAQAAHNPATQRSTNVTSTLSSDQEDQLLTFLADFFEMDDFDMAIVKRMYLGMDGQRIATDLHTSKQVICNHLKCLVEKKNRMVLAVKLMDRKGIGGKKRGTMKGGFVQQEMQFS